MASTKPLVGVSTGFTDYGDYLGLAFARPLAAAGAVPVVLPYLEPVGELLGRLDAAVLAVGRDLDPALYGAEPHPAQTHISPHRDRFELELARAAVERGVPLLGVCRGLQVLNVAFGGSLFRDRSEYPPRARGHPGGDWPLWDEVCAATLDDRTAPEHPSHAIAIEPGSALATILGTRAHVNSYHHQAVRELGRGLRAVAHADDGTVEAIELPDAPAFVLAVQWELQESWRTDRRFLRIFEALARAACEHPPRWKAA